MAKNFRVTTATMRQKAQELHQMNSKLKSEISNLQSQESSLNAMWDGEANEAFHNAFHKDVVQMNNFYNAIEKYVSSLNEICQEYERAEKTNVATAQTRK